MFVLACQWTRNFEYYHKLLTYLCVCVLFVQPVTLYAAAPPHTMNPEIVRILHLCRFYIISLSIYIVYLLYAKFMYTYMSMYIVYKDNKCNVLQTLSATSFHIIYIVYFCNTPTHKRVYTTHTYVHIGQIKYCRNISEIYKCPSVCVFIRKCVVHSKAQLVLVY